MEKRYLCTRCKEHYSSEEIRLTSDSRIICLFCLGLKERKIEKTPLKKELKKDNSLVEYFCSNCKYKFKRKKSVEFRLCPYCGKEGKVKVVSTINAEKIIDESKDKRYDF
jgi:DNA-directed RNA polymerase subunit RPC12/RpoP